MTVYKDHTNEQYETFLKGSFASNFGVSKERIAKWFAGAFPGILRDYGLTEQMIISDVIPVIEEKSGGGYVLFLITSAMEGGGFANWINHFAPPDAAGGWKAGLIEDLHYIYGGETRDGISPGVIHGGFPPAMSDYGGQPPNGTYVEDVPGKTQEMLNQMPDGSIGAYYMPSTMAGNAWVFGTNWCTANAPYPWRYSNPYDDIIRIITEMGGDPFNGEAPNVTEGNTESSPGATNPPTSMVDLGGIVEQTVKTILDHLKSSPIHTLSEDTYSNGFITVTKTYNNLWHLNVKLPENLLDGINTGINDYIKDKNKGPETGGPTTPPGENLNNENNKSPVYDRILEWCEGNIGGGYSNAYGLQCVAMIQGFDIALGLGLTGPLSFDNAWNIHAHDLTGTGWHMIDDGQGQELWDRLPKGAIVFYSVGIYGHVAVKKSDTYQEVYQQNGLALEWGSPLTADNLGNWVNGPHAAWVMD